MKSKLDHRFGTFSIVLILTGVLICLAALRFTPARAGAGSLPVTQSNRQPVAPADSERFARPLYGTLPLTLEPNWDPPNEHNTHRPAAACFAFQQHPSPNMQDIGVGPNGTVWGAGADSNVYRFIGNTVEPVPTPGPPTGIAVDSNGNPWVVTTQGNVYKFNGSSFVAVSGAAKDVGIGRDGTVWTIGTDGNTYRFNGSSPQLISSPGGGNRIAVDPNGNAWITTTGGNIFKFNGSSFVSVSGSARDVGIGADGTFWIVGSDNNLYRYTGSSPQQIPGLSNPLAISVDRLGLPWVVTFGGQVSSGISPITLSPTTLPNGTVGATYNQTITAIGGTAPDAFAVSFGVLPSGLALSLSGELSGTPRIADSFTFTLQATDSNGCVGTKPYTVVITASPTI